VLFAPFLLEAADAVHSAQEMQPMVEIDPDLGLAAQTTCSSAKKSGMQSHRAKLPIVCVSVPQG
jgi:hypothetical protein